MAELVVRYVPELVGWATLSELGRRKRMVVEAKAQEGLVMNLLEVYMREGLVTLFGVERLLIFAVLSFQ